MKELVIMHTPRYRSMLWPKPIEKKTREKGKVGLVTLSAPEPAENPDAVERGVKWLKDRNWEPVFAGHFLQSDGFLAASPQQIAADLHALLQRPEVSWILSAGGGENSNSILPYLDYRLIRKAKKPIIGLSNPSVILNAIAAKSKLVAFHGPVLLWNFGSEDGGVDPFTERHFWQMLGCSGNCTIKAERGWKWHRKGDAAGILAGGNLWSIQQLLGTPYQPDWNGAVLFIEDCFCELHQVAAILEHFAAAGVLAIIGGLIIGVPLEVAETERVCAKGFDQIVMEICAPYDFPVLGNVHLGHTDRKLTLPVNGRVRLSSTLNAIEVIG